MIHKAVLHACDARDGLQDGLITDPRACQFDFRALACAGAERLSCLSAGQVETARLVTSPAVHSQTGEVIFPGLALGTELGWATKVGGTEPSALGTEFFKYIVYKEANWDWRTFDFESAVALADRIDNGTLNVGPDLRGYRGRGGKLLLYHGWRDQNFSAESTINYHDRVRSSVGAAGSEDWMRLFLAPGVGHCGGGEGPNSIDFISALEQWVEHGRAPGQVIATRRADGKVVRTRPLCPYPQVARYRGTGSIDEASNFACVMP
jgi:feruloyl esterase